MALVIHIGSQKTGSTAIQSVLAQNVDVLRARGVNYLAAGRTNIAHNALAQDLRHGDPSSHFDALAEEVAAAPAMIHLISSEMLFHEPVAVRLYQGLPSDLRGEVRLICYLRRHDLYLEAMYKQLLKNGKIRANPKAFLERRRRTAAYGPVLDAFAAKFGRASITVRPFERARFPGGDVVSDFLRLLGIEEGGMTRGERPANQTLSAEVTEILGEISRHTRINTRPIIRELIASGANGTARSGDVFDPDSRAELLAEMAEDVTYVSATYGDSDMPFFALIEAGSEDLHDGLDSFARYKFALSEVLAAFGRWRR